jgi:hypothetical protein
MRSCALFCDGGGVFGNSGFCVRHGGESFLRLVGARRFITRVAEKSKGKLAISAKNLEEANGWRWLCSGERYACFSPAEAMC